MRNRLDEQLELLNTELIRMGALCEDGLSLIHISEPTRP